MTDRHTAKRASMTRSLTDATERTLDEWVDIVSDAPVDGFMERVEWLKAEYGLDHFQARLIVEEARDSL